MMKAAIRAKAAVRSAALAILTATQLFTPDAHASRARQVVMGTADPLQVISRAGHGSLYYDDNYNIFYNPSYANDHRNWTAFEKSNGTFDGTTFSSEGGFVMGLMNFSFGAFLNREGGIPVDAFPTVGNDLRPVDLIVAGDFGFRWGLNLQIAGNRIGPGAEAGYHTLNLGAQFGDFEPFARFSAASREDTGASDFTTGEYLLGTHYRWGEMRFFGIYHRGEFQDSEALGLGVTRSTRLGENSTFNYALAFWRSFETSRNLVPLDLSVEGEFTPWFVARAGLTYHIYDRASGVTVGDDVDAGSGLGTVSTRIGATIRFNKLDFDWAIGGGSPANPQVATPAFDFGNGFFADASLTYRW